MGIVHQHGVIDTVTFTTERGIWAIKWSFWGLLATAFLQIIVVLFTGSIALLADTLHNFGDAATAVPLWIAFKLTKRAPNNRFTYGYGRMEDLAGVIIILLIFLSVLTVGYESFLRLFYPRQVLVLLEKNTIYISHISEKIDKDNILTSHLVIDKAYFMFQEKKIRINGEKSRR